jgi:hypothetical protein
MEEGGRSLKMALILTFIFCITTSGFVFAQTAEDYFQQGKANLENELLTEANNNFQQALGLDPNHEGANLFYALTRLAVISQTSSFNTLLDRAGVSSSGRTVFNWTADFARDPTGKILLPPNSPTGAELQSYLKTDILPEVNSSLNNLSKVSNAYATIFRLLTAGGTGTLSGPNTLTDSTQSWINNEFGGFRIVVAGIEYTIVSNTVNTITVSPDWSLSPGSYSYNVFEPIDIDYGDVLVFKGALTAAKAGIYIVTAYNLDVDIDVLLSLYNAATLNIQTDIINAYPQLLALLPDQQLPQAKLILKEAISLLTAAIDFIVSETNPQDYDLIVIDNPADVERFRLLLADVDSALDTTTTIREIGYPVNLSQFFGQPKTLRNYLPTFTKQTFIAANTFPDPTFGGILPAMTSSELNQLLWNYVLYPEALRWTSVSLAGVSTSWGLSAVHFTSGGEGWTVGSDSYNHRGVLLHYSNGAWASVIPPTVSTNWYLASVHFTSAGEGWAVGSDSYNHRGVLLHYSNGTWASVIPPTVSTNWYLASVHFTSGGEGWAVGSDYSNGRGVLLHYLNGIWTSLAPPPQSPSFLSSVYFTSPNEGWAAGMGNVFLRYYNGSWTAVMLPDVGKMVWWSGIYFDPSGDGWIVGENWLTGGGVLLKYSTPGIFVGQDGLCGGNNTCYTSIQDGIDSAQSYAIMEITQETYNENVILNIPKVVTLQGGWDTNFTSSSSYTTINGSITITNGTMIFEYIILK